MPWLHFAGNVRSLFDNGNFNRYPSLFAEFNPGAAQSSTSTGNSGASTAASTTAEGADAQGDKGTDASTEPATPSQPETASLNAGNLLYQKRMFSGPTYNDPYNSTPYTYA